VVLVKVRYPASCNLKSYLSVDSPLPPAGLRNCDAAAFASFKKILLRIFLNPAWGGTEVKEILC